MGRQDNRACGRHEIIDHDFQLLTLLREQRILCHSRYRTIMSRIDIQSDIAKQNAGTNNATKIFVNLPVEDLKKTMDFFSKLGFKFNPMFTDENAACMVISQDIYAMLLVEKFFKSFIPDKQICDTKSSTEALIALSA